MIDMIARAINACLALMGMSSGCISSSFSGIFVNKALYRPKCRPDGEVVVDSLHDLIFPLNSVSVISYGRRSSSVAALQESNSDWHCGIKFLDC